MSTDKNACESIASGGWGVQDESIDDHVRRMGTTERFNAYLMIRLTNEVKRLADLFDPEARAEKVAMEKYHADLKARSVLWDRVWKLFFGQMKKLHIPKRCHNRLWRRLWRDDKDKIANLDDVAITDHIYRNLPETLGRPGTKIAAAYQEWRLSQMGEAK